MPQSSVENNQRNPLCFNALEVAFIHVAPQDTMPSHTGATTQHHYCTFAPKGCICSATPNHVDGNGGRCSQTAVLALSSLSQMISFKSAPRRSHRERANRTAGEAAVHAHVCARALWFMPWIVLAHMLRLKGGFVWHHFMAQGELVLKTELSVNSGRSF